MPGDDEPLLVLGATSLIGRFLLPRLDATARPYVAVSRHADPDPRRLQADLEHLSPGDVPRAGRAVSLSPIWLLPAALPALAAAGVTRIVAVSSTSRLTKAASADPAERAVAARLAAGEDALASSGLNWTVLRPTLIYAEGQDANVTRLARLIVRFGFLPLSGGGQGLRQPVHADDLAAGVIAALDSPAAEGRAFDVPGGETLSYREMCIRLFEALGRPPRLLSLPPPVWRAAFALARPFMPGAASSMGDRMSEDLVFDPAAGQLAFGWNPRPFRPSFEPPRR